MRDGAIHLCINPTYTIDVNGRLYAFDWNSYCGPTVVSAKTGEVFKRWPFSERHPFWKALEVWVKGGHRVDGDGRCLLDAPVSAPQGP